MKNTFCTKRTSPKRKRSALRPRRRPRTKTSSVTTARRKATLKQSAGPKAVTRRGRDPRDPKIAVLMSQRAGTRGNYPYHSLGRLASLRGCEVLLVVVQASVGYCVLFGCLSRCTMRGCCSTKAAHKCEGVGNGWEGLH